MNLGMRFGRIGFLVGFIGPILFYSVPYTFESHIACPLCPYIDAFGHPLFWLEAGFTLGLIQGLTFALFGFAVGYSIFKVKSKFPDSAQKKHT